VVGEKRCKRPKNPGVYTCPRQKIWSRSVFSGRVLTYFKLGEPVKLKHAEIRLAARIINEHCLVGVAFVSEGALFDRVFY